MRRKDLESGRHVDDGLYLVDGESNDPMGLVVHGPFPHTPEGRAAAHVIAEQIAARIRRPVSICVVLSLPSE